MTPRIRALIAGLLAGLLYGLALRFMGQEIDSQAYLGIMSIAFLFVGPLAIGAISVQDKNQSLLLSFFWPAVPITLGCLVTLALKWEGLICILMYLPVGIIFAGIGGIVGRQLLRRNQRKAVLVLLFMPFLVSPLENTISFPVQMTRIQRDIDIHASPETVWNEIKSVRLIEKAELRDSWVLKMGFPRPMDAVIDRDGVGGVRLARFAGNLVFHETVYRWLPSKDLAFKIAVDPDSIPPTTLDSHVTIGGRYFDVLDGEYEIERRDANTVRLHLTSRFRLSTHFNLYAGAWADAIMGRIQSDILEVIKKRSEMVR